MITNSDNDDDDDDDDDYDNKWNKKRVTTGSLEHISWWRRQALLVMLGE